MNHQNVIKDFLRSLQFLTRLPISKWEMAIGNNQRPFIKCVWAFPLAHFIVSLFLVILSYLLYQAGLPASVNIALVLVAGLFITGALHEDGLADCADGFGGGREKHKKLAIMKDSHIGTYGVSALICLFLLRYSLYENFLNQSFFTLAIALITSFVLSGSLMVLFWHLLPFAKEDGLANSVGKPSSKTTLIALIIGFLCSAFLLPFAFSSIQILFAFLMSALTFLLFRHICLKQIGGQTGDTIGALKIITECTFLTSLSIT